MVWSIAPSRGTNTGRSTPARRYSSMRAWHSAGVPAAVSESTRVSSTSRAASATPPARKALLELLEPLRRQPGLAGDVGEEREVEGDEAAGAILAAPRVLVRRDDEHHADLDGRRITACAPRALLDHRARARHVRRGQADVEQDAVAASPASASAGSPVTPEVERHLRRGEAIDASAASMSSMRAPSRLIVWPVVVDRLAAHQRTQHLDVLAQPRQRARERLPLRREDLRRPACRAP